MSTPTLPADTVEPRALATRTPGQVNAFVSAFRIWTETHRRVMDQALVLQALYVDLGMSNITDADLTGENAGLSAADVNTALNTAGGLITEFTAARRASFNRISHGNP